MTSPGLPDAERFLADGAQRCAQRLARICRAPWGVARTAAGPAAQEDLESLSADITNDHFGAYLSVSGAGVLTLFDRRSGLRVCHRFAGDFTDQVEALDEPQPAALCEVASLLVNALAEGLDRHSGRPLLVSAPQPLIDNPRGLLQAAREKLPPGRAALPGCARLICPELAAESTLVVFLPPDFVI